eukprot:945668-Pyramimonas_sp.AAC.2
MGNQPLSGISRLVRGIQVRGCLCEVRLTRSRALQPPCTHRVNWATNTRTDKSSGLASHQ